MKTTNIFGALIAAALLASNLTSAQAPSFIQRWADLNGLDNKTAIEKYQQLLGKDWEQFARARMYFQQNGGFEILASAFGQSDDARQMAIVDALLAKKDYSPKVVNVVVAALERLNDEPAEPSGELYAGQRAMKAHMSVALSRWLAIPDPGVASREDYSTARAKYAVFVSQAKQKTQAIENSPRE